MARPVKPDVLIAHMADSHSPNNHALHKGVIQLLDQGYDVLVKDQGYANWPIYSGAQETVYGRQVILTPVQPPALPDAPAGREGHPQMTYWGYPPRKKD